MTLVLDTNIVLDLFVFKDERVAPLLQALAHKEVRWLATPAMRDELATVLAYELIAARLGAMALSPQQVLASFDEHASIVAAAPPCRIACRDPDDQKFVDLAHAHQALLLSKDKAVLALRRKLPVAATFTPPSSR